MKKSPLTQSLSKGPDLRRARPDLRRARLAASATKGLTVKPGAGGRLLWYWEPNRAEKLAGWTPLKFGEDKRAALAGSDSRNAEVAAWRRGEDPETGDMEAAQAGAAKLGRPTPVRPLRDSP